MREGKKIISILGATGSIGVQTLDVLDRLKDSFEIGWLTVNNNIELLERQTAEFSPKGVVINNEKSYKEFKSRTNFKGEILMGSHDIIRAACDEENDLVLSALVGFSGVEPTLAAINCGIDIALANKETLVAAGEIITKAASAHGVNIFAVDSEHSAILQCIVGERHDEIEKLILTASGGPFRETPKDDFAGITVRQALNHPNWSMGSKITIDSASMMNKGFEIIEAYWLFGLPAERIDVLIHPQSIVHSMVQFNDGSIKAQLGLPDMRIPISYAINYPNRMKFDFPRADLAEISTLTFSKPDLEKFPCLGLAYKALEIGGTAPAIVNASNEIAVASFLSEKIRFVDIADCIMSALEGVELTQNPDIDQIIETDALARAFTENYINKKIKKLYN